MGGVIHILPVIAFLIGVPRVIQGLRMTKDIAGIWAPLTGYCFVEGSLAKRTDHTKFSNLPSRMRVMSSKKEVFL